MPFYRSYCHLNPPCAASASPAPQAATSAKHKTNHPEGDGCGAELQSWFTDRSWMKPKPGTYTPKEPMKLDAMPAECRRVLTERG